MDIIVVVFLAGLGLIIGSFLNVVIYRMRTGKSAMKGRSCCFSCGKNLEARDLVPILSFCFLRGRCRRCKVKISWQYPVVESLGLISVLVPFLVLEPTNIYSFVGYISTAIFFCTLTVMSVYDIRHKIIPDSISITLFVFAFLSVLFRDGTISWPSSLFWYGALVIPASLFFLWAVTRGRGIGFGDVKLAPSLGLLLGLSSGITALLLSFWIGAALSLIIMAFNKFRNMHSITMKSEVPFGPYLALGTFLAFAFQIDFSTLSSWLTF